MARKAAWEDLANADLGPYAKSRGTNWGGVFFGLLVVATATFVAAYYVPLFRAHQRLGDQFNELSLRAQSLSADASKVHADLAAISAQRDQLQAEHDQHERGKKGEADQLERMRGSLAVKLDKFSKKGSALVASSGGSLFVVLDSSLLFLPGKLDVSPAGRALLCDTLKAGEAKSVSVRDTLAEGATVPPALAASFASPWALSASRAAAVAQVAQAGCALAAAQLSATGMADRDQLSAAQLTGLKSPLDHVELELSLH